MRESFYGVRRFEQFQASLGLGRNILTERLRRLVANGLLERRKYQDRPARYEYRLTDKGRDFYPVMATIMAWGDRHLDRGRGAPVKLRHRGHLSQPTVVCSECGEPLDVHDMSVEPGPGLPHRLLKDPIVGPRFRPRPSQPAQAVQ